MKRHFTLCVMMFAVIVLSFKANSQTAPLYSFNSHTLDSGTALTTGAVYRFANVYTGVDALVKITGMSSGITLRDIDRTADGYGEAFQPEYRVSGSTNGYIDFRITYVNHNASTVVSQALVSATGLDIDGSSSGSSTLKEYNRIDMGGGAAEYNSINSQLIISQTGTAFTGANNTGVLFGVLVDTSAKEVMYSVTATNVSILNFRVGANNQMSGNSTRYASLYFKKFNYQHFPLALNKIISFSGSRKYNGVELKIVLSSDHSFNRMQIERSSSANSFSTIGQMEVGGKNGEMLTYLDMTADAGTNYYRVRFINSETGKEEISSTLLVRANTNDGKPGILTSFVQPGNPVLGIRSQAEGEAMLRLVDMSGNEIVRTRIRMKAGINSISLPSFNAAKGYLLAVLETNGQMISRKLFIQ
jgi:hypothetical protein